MILNPGRFRETETVREILRRPTSRLYRRLSQIFGRDPGLVSLGSGCVCSGCTPAPGNCLMENWRGICKWNMKAVTLIWQISCKYVSKLWIIEPEPSTNSCQGLSILTFPLWHSASQSKLSQKHFKSFNCNLFEAERTICLERGDFQAIWTFVV